MGEKDVFILHHIGKGKGYLLYKFEGTTLKEVMQISVTDMYEQIVPALRKEGLID